MTPRTGVNAPRERQPHGAERMRVRTLKMTDTDWARVQELAAEQGCTAGAIIRRAVEAYTPEPATR